MKKLTTTRMLIALVCLLITTTSFTKKQTVDDRIMIYALVYSEKCNTQAVTSHTYALVAAADFKDAYTQMKESMQNRYPNAVNIAIGNSKFDYGSGVRAMSILKWESDNSSCKYYLYTVAFGRTSAEALEKALEAKNSASGKYMAYETVEQKYW